MPFSIYSVSHFGPRLLSRDFRAFNTVNHLRLNAFISDIFINSLLVNFAYFLTKLSCKEFKLKIFKEGEVTFISKLLINFRE